MQLWMQGLQRRDDCEAFMSIISSFIPDPNSHLADMEAPHGAALMSSLDAEEIAEGRPRLTSRHLKTDDTSP